jgi:hypothetical protein
MKTDFKNCQEKGREVIAHASQNQGWLPQRSRDHGEKEPHKDTCPGFVNASKCPTATVMEEGEFPPRQRIQ